VRHKNEAKKLYFESYDLEAKMRPPTGEFDFTIFPIYITRDIYSQLQMTSSKRIGADFTKQFAQKIAQILLTFTNICA